MVGKAGAVAIAFIIILSTIPLSYSVQTPEYYENITLYLVGRSVLVRYNFTGTHVGLVDSKVLEEKFPGVDYFKLYLSQFDSFPSEYTYLSSLGYSVLLCDYNVPSMAALYVHSKTLQEASAFAEEVENLTGLSFTPYGESGGMFIFISPSSYVDVLENFLWNNVPKSYGGFASLLDKRDAAFSTIREIGFIGRAAGGKILQSVIVDVFKANSFSGASLRTGLDLFLSSRVNTSSYSNMSSFKIVSYGQVIEGSDAGNVRRDISQKTSELTLNVPGGSVLNFPNITLSADAPSLIVQREISRTAIRSGEEFEVQVRLKNIGLSSAKGVSFEDSWWIKGGRFTLTAGKYYGQLDLGVGENRTIVYRLKAQSDNVEEVYVPPLDVVYFWEAGGERLSLKSSSNDAYILLNRDGASVYATATASSSQASFGLGRNVVLEVKNRGSMTAFNVTLYGERIEFLPPGESFQKTVTADLDGLIQPFKDEVFRCQWSDGEKVKGSASNSIILSNGYGKSGITILSLDRSVRQVSLESGTFLNVTLTMKSFGAKSVSNLTLVENVPNGLRYVNGSLTLQAGRLYAFEEAFNANSSKSYRYLFEVEDSKRNYVLEPAYAEYFVGGRKYFSLSAPNGMPVGLNIVLLLEESDIFQNCSVSGQYAVENLGDKSLYRVSAEISHSPSLNITLSGKPVNMTVLKPGLGGKAYFKVYGESLGFNNSVYLKVKYFFGGKLYNVNSTKVYVNVHKPPQVKFSTLGEAVEGKTFEFRIVVENVAPLKVEDLQFKVFIPTQIKVVENLSPSTAKVSNNTVEASIKSLEGNSEEVIALKLASGAAKEYTISTSEISFTYRGEVLKAPQQTTTLKVSDDILSRYLIPLALAVAVMVLGKILLGAVRRG